MSTGMDHDEIEVDELADEVRARVEKILHAGTSDALSLERRVAAGGVISRLVVELLHERGLLDVA